MTQVALLENEIDLRKEIAFYLSEEGYTVAESGSVGEFLDWFAGSDCRLFVIDVGLPDGSGFDVVEAVRARNPEAGIILLTARSATEDKLRGLNGGADQYLVKPIKLAELTAYIGALARRVPSGWRLRVQESLLCSPTGREMPLTQSELQFLQLFVDQTGLVSRRQVVEAKGEEWYSYDLRRLDTMVSRLRRRWRAEMGMELPLRTEHAEGYVFCAPLAAG